MEKMDPPQPANTHPSDLKVMTGDSILNEGKDIDLGQILEVESSPRLEQKVLRKIDFMYSHFSHLHIILRKLIPPSSLIPLMGFCYMLQYMDKLALSEAALFNIREDLVTAQLPIDETNT
jgi:hypothetical protein